MQGPSTGLASQQVGKGIERNAIHIAIVGVQGRETLTEYVYVLTARIHYVQES